MLQVVLTFTIVIAYIANVFLMIPATPVQVAFGFGGSSSSIRSYGAQKVTNKNQVADGNYILFNCISL